MRAFASLVAGLAGIGYSLCRLREFRREAALGADRAESPERFGR